jgi:hypothetical protein
MGDLHPQPEREPQASRWPIALLLIAAVALAIAAAATVPRAIDAAGLLIAQDDPAQLADRRVAALLNAGVVAREIESALLAGDADLAQSFVDLAGEHQIAVAPILAARVAAAVKEANSPSRTVGNFAQGLVTGEPDDVAGLAGTALGDLFVFGDVRDAIREGARFAAGEEADEVVLGLACVGLAATAAAYLTFGTVTPVRLGLTVAKTARKTSRLSAGMTAWLGRSVRQVVDWDALKAALGGGAIAQPAAAMRVARQAVKLDRAGGFLDVAGSLGRVQSKAGARAALDGLKIARGPQDVMRIAKLAEKKGSTTRAILKLLGRGAIALTVGSMQLASWILWAILALFGFASSAKGAVERLTMRRLRRRRARRLASQEQDIRNRLAALTLSNAAPV